MKKVIFIALLLLACLAGSSRAYYFSAAGNDAAAGTSAATAWKTCARLNSPSVTVTAGDSLLFRRGDVFVGPIWFRWSGTSTRRIVIGAYGAGALPIISGFANVTTWTSTGTSLWQASVPGIKSNLLTIGGIPQAKGRWPNANDSTSDGGYIRYWKWTGSLTNGGGVTVTVRTAIPASFVGAELVIKPKNWTYYRQPITAQGDSTFSFSYPATPYNLYAGEDSFGLFVQNHPATLDKAGEWFASGSTLTLFHPNNPAALNVRASVVDTLLNLGSQSFVTVENLAFEGANVASVYSLYSGSGGIIVRNCQVMNGGREGITIYQGANCSVSGNRVSRCLGSGILIRTYGGGGLPGGTIEGNTVEDIAYLPGMDAAGDADINGRSGVAVLGSTGAVIRGNIIRRCGFSGFEWKGSNALIENNVVDSFGFVKDDVGGGYAYNGWCKPVPTWTGNIIRNNIIVNGIGAPAGAKYKDRKARGLYCDEGVNGVTITGNTIANCPGAALYGNNQFNITWRGNHLFNCGSSLSYQRLNCADTTRQLRFVGNTAAPFLVEIRDLAVDSPYSRTIEQIVSRGITSDSNLLVVNSPYPIKTTYRKFNTTGYVDAAQTYAWWTGTGKEARTIVRSDATNALRFVSNPTNAATTIYLGDWFIGVDRSRYCDAILLQPYQSKTLVRVTY